MIQARAAKPLKKPRNIRLNLLRTYAVHWDDQTFVRDVIQNSFDASNDFEGITIAIDRAEKSVRLEGPKDRPPVFPEHWVASESAPRWRHANAHARRLDFRVATSSMASIGMRLARETWLTTVQPVAESELTVVHRARREVLLAGGRLLYPGKHPPLSFARMSDTMAGEYRHSEIVLEFELLDGSLAQALSTYVHELCHEAGRDGDAKFSDELTSALGIAFELHGVIAGLERCWKQIAVEDPAKLEVALGEAEPALRMQALVRMVSD